MISNSKIANLRKYGAGKMPQKANVQTISGGIKDVVIMPTYGTPSFIYKAELGLPWVVSRGEDDTAEDFIKKLRNAEVKLFKVAKEVIGKEVTDLGHWLKERKFPDRQIQHYRI